MRGSGGTEGGAGQFFFGLGLSVAALYFLFDSVRATTEVHGVISGMLRRGRGGLGGTASMGLLFVPFFLGVTALFYNAKMRWAWGLMWLGLAIIVIEILSRIRFHMDVKTTYLLGVIVMFSAGAGLMLRSYRDDESEAPPSLSRKDREQEKGTEAASRDSSRETK